MKIKTKHVYLSGVGYIPVTRDKRAKQVKIVINEKGVRVTIPYTAGFEQGEYFIFKNEDWIKRGIEKIEKKRLIFDENTTFRTKNKELIVFKRTDNFFSNQITENKIIIGYPAAMLVTNETVQQYIKENIDKVLLEEAKEYLPARTEFLANLYGLKFSNLRINRAKTRWGSCSSKNSINLTCYLMLLPDNLIDYVILHELTHTIYKNHSKDFWNYLNKLTHGKAKELRKQLKNYSTLK